MTTNNKTEETKEPESPKNKKSSLEGLAQLAGNLRAVVMNLAIIFLISCLIVFVYKEIDSDLLIVKPFAVPEYLAETGYTGKAVSNRLMDQINFIFNEAQTSVARKEFTGAWAKEQLQIEMPGTGLSLAHINRLLKDLFGKKTTQVAGEIVLLNEDNGDLELTVRISGNPAKPFTGNIQNLKPVLLEAAEYVVECLQPYILAAYQYSSLKEDLSIRERIERQKLCEKTLKYIIENEPTDDDASAYNLWGILLWEQTARRIYFRRISSVSTKNAIEKFEKSISLQPEHPHAYINLGKLYLDCKAYSKATEHLQKYNRLAPDDAEFYFLWGQALTATGKEDEADDKFNRAVLLDPKMEADILMLQGKKNLAKKEYGKAIKKFTKVVEINPDIEDEKAEINFLWSNALEKTEKYQESLKKIKKALKIKPENVDFFIAKDRLNALYDKTMIPTFEKKLEKKPDDVVTKNQLAWTYVTLPAKEDRKPERGLILAKEAVEAARRSEHPGLPSFLDTLAAAYAENGKFNEAVKSSKEAISISNEYQSNEYQEKHPFNKKKYKEVREKAKKLLSKAYKKSKTYCQYQEEIKRRALKDKEKGGDYEF